MTQEQGHSEMLMPEQQHLISLFICIT